MAAEFLPLCDVLFNVISLAGYFCDVVFDLVMCYALLERGHTATAAAALAIVACSLLVSQVVSLRWYLHVAGGKRRGFSHYAPYVLHCLQLGVLWRYAKLFVPVDLRYVKHEVRNLCMLRLVHAFCEAAPMLLLQLHVLAGGLGGTTTPTAPTPPQHIFRPDATAAFTELTVISASLSLFSVCWALASFSKNVRLQNVHRLVLTWLGVIFQFAWRLGTISARVTALTVYASLYEHWVFLVIGLHWVSMFLWLISPKNVFHGERISRPRKAYLSALIAFVYVFAYVNLQEVNHRQKMVTFYLVMLVENCLLVCVWAAGMWGLQGFPSSRLAALPLLVLASFSAGIAFMLLYYRYFHVRRLGYELGGRLPPIPANSTDSKLNGQFGDGCYDGPQGTTERIINNNCQQRNAIPGVFNCRFVNPVGGSGATKRKKKKPTSFVPPPAAPPAPLRALRPAPLPFWRRPLPAPHQHSHCGSSENESSSIGSRINIHQKLQEKKQKQLAELKVIEEEIKQGKLANNTLISGDEIYSSLQRQPIPRTKKHIDLEPLTWAPPSPELGSLGQSFENLNSLGQPNCSQSPKNYDALTNSSHQNNGYENFAGFSQNALAASNLVGQFMGSFPSYTEIPNTKACPVQISSINYETVNQISNNNRNMSPSSQISNGEQSNSLTRQILPRSKNPRQFISSAAQHRQNVYPSQMSDMQRASEQARLLYGDSNSPRTVLNENNNARIQRNYPENAPVQRISNFSPTIDAVNRNSPRNITNMSPRTIYMDGNSGSKSNSYERTQNNRLIDNISPRQLATSSAERNYEKQHHGRQFSGVYSVTNQDTQNNFLETNRQDNLMNLRHNFYTGDSLNKNSDSNGRGMFADGSVGQRFLAEGGKIVFPYQGVAPPKAKLERPANLNMVEQARKMQRCKTPEILLAPHFLETRQTGCHWGMPPYRCQQDGECCQQTHQEAVSSGEGEPSDLQGNCRPSSDIDSQISLPRSYTLPREFKYYRRNRQRRLARPDHFVASTNSSDGDVDSGDDNESERLSNGSKKSQLKHPDVGCNRKSPSNGIDKFPSKHQHSISQPSSTHFQELQSENSRRKVETRGQLSCQNVSIYGKMSANNSKSPLTIHDAKSEEDLEAERTQEQKIDEAAKQGTQFDAGKLAATSGQDKQQFYAGVSPAHGRQLRNRMYGISKLGMIKHETKL